MITDEKVGSRPVRRQRSELKQIVLEAAVEVLRELPPALSVETLSYVRVFDHLRENYGVTVTRGSVHERIWSSVQDFRMDTLLHCMTDVGIAGLEPLKKLVEESMVGADIGTVAGRRDCFATMFMNIDPYFQHISAAVEPWTGFSLNILATIQNKGDGPTRDLADAMATFDARRESSFVDIFGGLFEMLGLRVRSELEMSQEDAMRHFFRTSNDLIEGQRLYEQAVDLRRPTLDIHRNGKLETWPQLGFAIHAIALSMFEFVELATD